jgi:threonyl-tRNA synthetase
MIIMYDFQLEDYDYEVDIESLRKASVEIFAKNYGIELEKAQKIFDEDWISLEQIEENFYSELYAYFEDVAYREFISRRYE